MELSLFRSIMIVLLIQLTGFAQIADPDESYVQTTLAEMSVEEKIGQILCPTILWNTQVDTGRYNSLVTLIEDYHIGTFHVVGGTASNLVPVLNGLQEISQYPLLYTADLEGGLSPVIADGTIFPRAMALASTNNSELIQQVAEITAREGRAVGLGINYYPVMDVNTDPNNPIINYRAFSDDPEMVSQLGLRYISGSMQGGMIPTAKHFPGHGPTAIDTHSGSAILDIPENTMREIHLTPFQQAIDFGIPAIMTGHLIAPTLGEPELPATLSPIITTDLLQHEMGFEGITITDAMLMKAITNDFTQEEAAVMALNAGADLIIFPPSPNRYHRAILEGIETGAVSIERLNDAVTQVLRAKTRLGLHQNRLIDEETFRSQLKTDEAIRLSNQAAAESMILQRNYHDRLPMNLVNQNVFILQIGDLGVAPYESFGRPFVQETETRAGLVTVMRMGTIVSDDELASIISHANAADVILCNVFLTIAATKDRIDLTENHINTINQLQVHQDKLIYVGFGSPYALRHFPWVRTAVLGCDTLWEMQRAAIRSINGEQTLTGVLPVSLTRAESCIPFFMNLQ